MKHIICGTLVDGTGGAPAKDVVITIDGERIDRILPQSQFVPAAGDEVVDLSGCTVTPGFVDCHDHLCLNLGDEAAQCAQSDVALTITSVANARAMLESGITTLRDCGEKALIDIEVKKAVEAGLIPGPRLVTAALPIMRTGGHGHFLGREADGPWEVRKAVREQLKNGAEMIKILPSGGMSTRGSSPVGLEMTREEIGAAIDEAHRAGRKIAAHVHGGPAARICIEAGCDSIEHGLLLTPEEITLLAASRCTLVSTAGLSVTLMADDSAPAFYREKLKDAHHRAIELLKLARMLGVRLACGNDTNHARMDLELGAMVEAGFTPLEAITVATRNGAELCGLLEDIGTLEPGKFADLVAFAEDPLEDIAAVHHPEKVFKGGICWFSRASRGVG